MSLLFGYSPIHVEALTTTCHKEGLISDFENVSNGKMKITVEVPANSTVTVGVYPNNIISGKQYGSMMEEINFNLTNTTSKAKKMSKTFSVKFFGEYYAKANYGWNGSVWDDAKCISKLNGRLTTPKFKWTQNEINKYRKNEQFSIVANFGISTVIGFVAHPAVELTVSVFTLGVDLYSAGEIVN